MKKPGAEDVRRTVRKTSKKVPKGADEGASAIPPVPKRLRIGEAAPPVPKKPRTDKGASGSSKRSALATLGERVKALSVDGVLDLMASTSPHPERADTERGASARPSTSAAVGPSDPGPSRPSTSAQIPVGAESQGPPDTESLGEGIALGDPATTISLFQSILLPADVEEVSQCSLTEITNSVFPALAWVSHLTLLFFHILLIDF